MKKTILTIVLATLCLFFKAGAQDIKPLKVGDKVPEILWDMPLTVINHSEGKQTINLRNYKGKLIILDFWGSYCAPCIRFLPKLDSLGQDFKPQIHVLPISDFKKADELSTALNRLKVLSGFKAPIALFNEKLKKYFPHQFVSHVIWINRDGIVCAITESDYVTKNNIEELLAGKKVQWPQKRDFKSSFYKKPLLSFNHSELQKPQRIYSSVLTGNMEGISPPMGTYRDSSSQTSTTGYYNMELLAMCQMAMEYRTGAPVSQFILDVKDKTRYIKNDNITYREWSRDNTYCYSVSLPLTLSEEQLQMIIKADLIRWLAVLGITVTKTGDGKFLVKETPTVPENTSQP